MTPLFTKAKQIGGVLMFQGISFVLTFCTNILILRTLSKTDYAIFTVCFQILSVVTLLSDSGVTPAFRRLAGKYWDIREMFSSLVRSLLELRNRLLFAAVPISLLIACFLFYKQDGFNWRIIGWIALLFGMIYYEVQRGMYLEILRSQLQIRKVQIIENLLNLLRLILGLSSLLWNNIELLLFAYGVASLLTSEYAKRQAQFFFDVKAKSKKSYRLIMSAKYKELLPNSIFFIIQSQIAIFLLAFFHKAGGVADYGALGRITVVFNMLSAVVLNLFAIDFSRNQNLPALRKSYFKLIAIVIGTAILLFFTIFLFKHQIVSILGKKYNGLESLLVLLTFNSCINFILTSVGMLNNSKAWVFYNARFAIPVSIFSLVFGLFVLDFSNIGDVIIYSLLPIAFTGFLKIADSLRGLKIAFYQ